MLAPVPLSEISNWHSDGLSGFRQAWQRSCSAEPATKGPLNDPLLVQYQRRLCAQPIPAGTDGLRTWLEENFAALPFDRLVHLTGYYEPVLNGSLTRTAGYSSPVLQPPADLDRQSATSRAYFDRAAIEDGVLDGQAVPLAWLDPVDAFFLHIQGSGVIALRGGETMRVGYAADNGHDYHAIGRDLIRMGVLKREHVTMQAIQAWLRANPDKAPAIMQRNKRYIFFRKLNTNGPVGASGVVLTPGRSIAASPEMQTGLPIWLEAGTGSSSRSPPIRRLVMVQDKGAAIQGLRMDYFWGSGERAGELAGRTNAKASVMLLLPRGYVNTIKQR